MHDDPSPSPAADERQDPGASVSEALERQARRRARVMSLLAMLLPVVFGVVALKRAHTTVRGGVTRTVLLASYAEVQRTEEALASARAARRAGGTSSGVAAGAGVDDPPLRGLERAHAEAVAAYARRLADPAVRAACGGPEAPCRIDAPSTPDR